MVGEDLLASDGIALQRQDLRLDLVGQQRLVEALPQAGHVVRPALAELVLDRLELLAQDELALLIAGRVVHALLDRVAGGDRLAGLEPERAKFADVLAALREAEGDLTRLRESLATFAERRDYLSAAAAELDDAALREGELEELAGEAARLAHADRLRELATLAGDRLSEGEGAAVEGLGVARHAIQQAAELDPTLAEALATDDRFATAAALRKSSPLLDRAALAEAGELQSDMLAKAKTACEGLKALLYADASPSLRDVLQYAAGTRLFAVPDVLLPFVAADESNEPAETDASQADIEAQAAEDLEDAKSEIGARSLAGS